MNSILRFVCMVMLLLPMYDHAKSNMSDVQQFYNYVKSNDVVKVRTFLNQFSDIAHMTSTTGDTALHIAAREGHAQMILLLVNEWGMALESVNNSGNTPLIVAAYYGHESAVKTLIDLGANVNAVNCHVAFSCLHSAVIQGHVEIVKLLLSMGADQTIEGMMGTALDIARKNNDEVLIDLLS